MEQNDQEECVLCCRDIKIYATGTCDHPVCFECSTRMRILCETNECPICRGNMPVVIFTQQRQQFLDIANKFSLCDKKYNILFENRDIRKSFELLLEHRCKTCSEVFSSFEKLKDHVRRKHDLQYCDLCSNSLKIFTFERKCYSRQDLARHRRKGDPDETSHRGHPLCEFCDERYIDLDELFRHLRRDHFFCHMCDADGRKCFYSDYEELRVHFRKEHYLCEEGDCINEKFTSAFRSEIDLKAHVALCHSKNKSKAEAKQARMLEFEFTYAHHNRSSGNSSPRGGRFNPFRKRNVDENTSRESRSNPQMETEAIDTQSTQEFPYLSEDSVNKSNVVPTNVSNCNSLTVQSYGRHPYSQRTNVMSTDEFPALHSTTVAVTSEISNNQSRKFNFSINRQNNAQARMPSVSIHLSQKSGLSNARALEDKRSLGPSDSASEKTKSQNSTWLIKKSAPNFEDEFPKLEIRGPVGVSISNNIYNSLGQGNVPSKPVTTPENHSSGDHFVVIKGKPKKKKHSRDFLENKTDEYEDERSLSLQNKTGLMFNNQENEDPFKKNLVPTRTLPLNNFSEERFSTFTPPVSFGKEDFPPLESSEPPQKPPGFSEVSKQAPPPGFSSKTLPLSISLSSVARQITLPNRNQTDNPLHTQSTYANKNEVYKSEPHVYRKPPDFEKRNEKLKDEIQEMLSSEDFSEFKTLSGKFRRSVISAKEYHTKCLGILGDKRFLSIFPLLVSLLPDIEKQQELLSVHNQFFKCPKNGGAIPKHIASASNQLVACSHCQQVLMRSDYESHNACHGRS